MALPRKGLLALAALDDLHHRKEDYETLITSADIARHAQCSPRYAEGTLQDLVKDGWLYSKKGPNGGFRLDTKALQADARQFFYDNVPHKERWILTFFPSRDAPKTSAQRRRDRMPYRKLLPILLAAK